MIAKKIIESGGGKKHDYLQLDAVQNELCKMLDGRKYLLVLDDVWNEDTLKWSRLKNMLIGGAKGSMILLTTCSDVVAEVSGSAHQHKLGDLLKEDAWTLFGKMAFECNEESKNSNLVEIGKEIVRKCGGIPLAIRSICSLLRQKRTEDEWIYFKNQELSSITRGGNDVMTILRLSFNYLPRHLKICFTYCSLFPKDFLIQRSDLIDMWIAQGFIQSTTRNRDDVEDVANSFFMNLFRRSFFQETELKGLVDLRNSLSIKFMGRAHAIGERTPTDVVKRMEHLQQISVKFECGNHEDDTGADLIMLEALQPHQNIEILEILNYRGSRFPSWMMVENLGFFLPKLVDLRIGFCCKCQKLPLLWKLPSLQGLELQYLDGLEDIESNALPTSSSSPLCNLKDLSLDSVEGLTTFPEDVFKNLTLLESLSIRNCRNLVSLSTCLTHLASLETLCIEDCPQLELSNEEAMQFQAPGNLSTFSVVRLDKIMSLPLWLRHFSDTLKSMDITECPNFATILDWIGYLIALNRLVSDDSPMLKSLPEGMRSLTALQKLIVIGEWSKNYRVLTLPSYPLPIFTILAAKFLKRIGSEVLYSYACLLSNSVSLSPKVEYGGDGCFIGCVVLLREKVEVAFVEDKMREVRTKKGCKLGYWVDWKKYLLVLDEVWNKDSLKWARLKNMLVGGT
ncbi:hypothetical protein T459_07295 [Capsicum annuum]|uniref:Uncharacterized protein n=1 Tax=Capsicum annuum TaxID=4072 RepID=A0A2G2ZT89_CAPAN|nr:hypothetical protein T459_07295 [Capsicum annuum]